MRGWRGWNWLASAGLLTVVLVACSQQLGRSGAALPAITEKTFAVAPDTTPVKVSFLMGQLQDMKISERVERATGKVVDPPELRGMLKLKNGSADQAVRLIAGKIEYVDTEGNPIPLAQGRSDTSFSFSDFQTERLDPGMETSQAFVVPFPAAVLKTKSIRGVRLELTYLPSAYREETVSIPVSLKS